MSIAIQISLNVSDLQRSVEFYRRLLGEPKRRRADYAKFVGEDPEIHLALMPGLERRGPGTLSHLGIRVDSSEVVRSWRRTFLERGLPVGDQTREDCCYALQEKFWVADPDGNRWEIYNVIEDAPAETERACTPETCCAR